MLISRVIWTMGLVDGDNGCAMRMGEVKIREGVSMSCSFLHRHCSDRNEANMRYIRIKWEVGSLAISSSLRVGICAGKRA